MAAAKRLLVVLKIFALFHAGLASRQCCSGRYGQRTNTDIQLGTSTLPIGEPSFSVEIPQLCNGDTMGVSVIACDYDVAPDVFVVSNNLAYVNRKGSLRSDGSVTAKVFCYNRWMGSDLYKGAEPSLSVEAIPESYQVRTHHRRVARYSIDSQDAVIKARHETEHKARRIAQAVLSSDTRQAEEDVHEALANNARQVILDEARHQVEHQARAAPSVNAHQTSDESRGALANYFRQAAEDQARQHDKLDTRLAKKMSDALRQGVDRRLRHDSQSSNSSQAAEVVRDAKVDKARQSPIDEIHKQASDEQRQSTQRRSRRAPPADNRKVDDTLRDALKDDSSRTAFGHDRFQTLNDILRAAQEAFTRQSTNMLREISAINAREADLAQTNLRIMQRASQADQAADTRQAADLVRETLINNARQAAMVQGRFQTTPGTNFRQADYVVLEALVENARQAALDQAQFGTKPGITRQTSDAVREALAQSARQAAVNQARLQAIQDNRFAQATNSRQDVDTVREALDNMRLQAENKVRRQGQTINARQNAYGRVY